MRVIFILATMLLLQVDLWAQCAEKPGEKAGGYKKTGNINNSGITGFGKANAKAIDAKIDEMAAVIQQAYPQPKGCAISWHPMPYEYNNVMAGRPSYYCAWHVQAYFCNSQTKKLALDETFLMPTLTVNGIDNHVFEKAGDAQQKINGKVAFTLPPLAEKKFREEYCAGRMNIFITPHRGLSIRPDLILLFYTLQEKTLLLPLPGKSI